MHTTIDLLRHGKCEGGNIFRGSTDVALSAEGWQQMQASLHSALHGESPWQQLISSPMQRCRLLAKERSEALSLPLSEEDDWRELHFGAWEGRETAQVWAEDSDATARFYADPVAHPIPEAEPMADFQQRVVAAFERNVSEFKGQHLLVLSHGGCIRVLLSHLLNMPLSACMRLALPYASLTRIKIYHEDDGDYPSLVFMNRGCEL